VGKKKQKLFAMKLWQKAALRRGSLFKATKIEAF